MFEVIFAFICSTACHWCCSFRACDYFSVQTETYLLFCI